MKQDSTQSASSVHGKDGCVHECSCCILHCRDHSRFALRINAATEWIRHSEDSVSRGSRRCFDYLREEKNMRTRLMGYVLTGLFAQLVCPYESVVAKMLFAIMLGLGVFLIAKGTK